MFKDILFGEWKKLEDFFKDKKRNKILEEVFFLIINIKKKFFYTSSKNF